MEGNRESGLWIPASQHQNSGEYEEDEEEEGSTAESARGREETRTVDA